MRILFLTETAPYPPRNGITIPMHNHIRLLAQHHDVTAYSFESGEYISETPPYNYKGNIEPLPKKAVIGAIKEVMAATPMFTKSVHMKDLLAIFERHGPFEAVYYSAISMHEAAHNFANLQVRNGAAAPRIIAAVSDCYTAVLRTAVKAPSASIKEGLKKRLRYFRSFLMAQIEGTILRKADAVLVQTQKDKDWMQRIGVPADTLHIMTNGVEDSIFSIKKTEAQDVLFVGNMASQYYQDIFVWFYTKHWPRIQRAAPDARLHLYTSGKGVAALEAVIGDDPTVILYRDFVKDLCDVYAGKAICLAPIFKDYGFINKVAEAMAAGLVVVGDASAFNGMADIADKKNCLIVSQKEDFSDVILEIINTPTALEAIGREAQSLAKAQFHWDSKATNLMIAVAGAHKS